MGGKEVTVFDLDSFVDACRTALRDDRPQLAVKELVERAVAEPRALDQALGTPGRGGMVGIHRSPELTILQFVWPPRVRLFPHDHRMWAAIGIYNGREHNAFFRRAEGRIVAAGGRDLDVGDTLVLGDDAVHAVDNPAGTYTAAIHVYGGDYFGTPRSEWDLDTWEERPFDVEHVRQVLARADEAASST
jgi:predicted metal-dependent enzyme (double-stranded beta helix superfamily)